MVHLTAQRRDRGAILPLVLVVSVVLAIVVLSIAGYVAAGLRQGAVVDERTERVTAADNGLRYAVEQFEQDVTDCGVYGSDTIDAPDTNGSTVTVSCELVGDGYGDIDSWALILTAEEIPTTNPPECTETVGPETTNVCTLMRAQSGSALPKVLDGPLYMSRLEFELKAEVELHHGPLLHTDPTCSTAPTLPALLSWDTNWIGRQCTSRPWSKDANPSTGLFSEPAVGTLPTNVNPPPAVDANGCTVFVPGHYTTAPATGANNYFEAGNYLFDGTVLTIGAGVTTAGWTDWTSGDDYMLDNEPCEDARDADALSGTSTPGATFYLRGGSRIEITANGELEVMRRRQGSSYVGVHVLDGSLTYDDSAIDVGPGTNKDLVMHGVVWAPEARITFGEVTNTANGQILGGAVISNIDIRTTPSGNGFVIAVEPSDLEGRLQLDSVATSDDGATTTMRAIVGYRPTTKEHAVMSWRVVE